MPDLGARAAGRGEGRVATSNDGKAAVSYTYSGTDAAGRAEYRGLVTATTVSGLTGTSSGFTAACDPDGALFLGGYRSAGNGW